MSEETNRVHHKLKTDKLQLVLITELISAMFEH